MWKQSFMTCANISNSLWVFSHESRFEIAMKNCNCVFELLRPRLHQGAGLNCGTRTRIFVHLHCTMGPAYNESSPSHLPVFAVFLLYFFEWVPVWPRNLGPLAFTSKLGRPEAGPILPPELVRMRTRFWYRILIFVRLHQNLGRPRLGVNGRGLSVHMREKTSTSLRFSIPERGEEVWLIFWHADWYFIWDRISIRKCAVYRRKWLDGHVAPPPQITI